MYVQYVLQLKSDNRFLSNINPLKSDTDRLLTSAVIYVDSNMNEIEDLPRTTFSNNFGFKINRIMARWFPFQAFRALTGNIRLSQATKKKK